MSERANRRDETSGRDELEKARARDRIVLDKIAELQGRVSALELELEATRRQREADARTLVSLEARISRMRLDKQLSAFPAWIAGRLRRDSGEPTNLPARFPHRLLVIAPTYPSPDRPYGGQPVERRLRFYVEAGYEPLVFVPSAQESEYERNGIRVRRDRTESIPGTVASGGYSQILMHHPTPETWSVVRQFVGQIPVHVWIHGFEARDWRDAAFGLSPDELGEKAKTLDPVNTQRRATLQEIFADERVTKIFVSGFMHDVAVEFVGVEPSNSRIIHNVIDPNLFPYRERKESDRLHVLTVRSFATRTYATDLMSAAIRDISEKGFFGDLEFNVFGDGRYFDEDTGPLGAFPNVTVTKGIVDADLMSSLMARSGVMLIPTRLDTQGMTIGEAMSTGMVVVTNQVAAIPEFVDEQSAMLCDAEDHEGLAEAIAALYRDPDRFLSMSRAARERVESQCGPENTVAQELSLIDAAAL